MDAHSRALVVMFSAGFGDLGLETISTRISWVGDARTVGAHRVDVLGYGIAGWVAGFFLICRVCKCIDGTRNEDRRRTDSDPLQGLGMQLEQPCAMKPRRTGT